jgi:hypothetical protein
VRHGDRQQAVTDGHGEQRALGAERRDEHEAGRERPADGSQRVPAVDPPDVFAPSAGRGAAPAPPSGKLIAPMSTVGGSSNGATASNCAQAGR